jgi:hypothetical protein
MAVFLLTHAEDLAVGDIQPANKVVVPLRL